jgi:predicted transcriptional regulator
MTKRRLIFVPGCFDDLDISQEELDSLVDKITDSFDNGDFEDGEPLDDEEAEELLKILDQKNSRQ